MNLPKQSLRIIIPLLISFAIPCVLIGTWVQSLFYIHGLTSSDAILTEVAVVTFTSVFFLAVSIIIVSFILLKQQITKYNQTVEEK